MADNKSKLTIEDYKSEFSFKKKENGLNIQVPPFIEAGDKIVIDTRTLEYVKKL